MRSSSACKDLIKQFEGLRLRAYLDDGGVPTIGWGHTGDVKEGDSVSRERAEEWLDDDIRYAENIVKLAVTVPLTQWQFDALVSFVFNVGPGRKDVKDGFVQLKDGRPSTMLTKLNAGDYEGAALEFRKWVNVKGQRSNGLVRRRSAEEVLFRTANAGGLQQAGHPVPAEQPPAPVEDRPVGRKPMAIPAVIAALVPALLPKLLSAIPELVKMLGDRAQPSHKAYAEVGAKVLEIAVESTGAANAQEAVERIVSDPVVKDQATKAFVSNAYTLVEIGGGVEAARGFAVSVVGTQYADVLKNVTYGALGFLLLANFGVFSSLIAAVALKSEHAQTLMNLGSMVVQADIGAALTAFGFWLGSSIAKTRNEEVK
jgi:lysozyme